MGWDDIKARVTTWRGLVGFATVLITWIGCFLAWAYDAKHMAGVVRDYTFALHGLIVLANLVSTLLNIRWIYSFSLGTASTSICFAMADLVRGIPPLPQGGYILAVLGVILSFFAYPQVDVRSLRVLATSKTKIPLAISSGLNLIGFICVTTAAAQVSSSHLAALATYSLLMGLMCLLVISFNLHNEMFSLLYLIGTVLSRSLGTVLQNSPPGYPPTATAGGALIWLASICFAGVLVMHVGELESATNSTPATYPPGRFRWRLICLIVSAVFILIGSIVFWTGGYPRETSYHVAALGFVVICAFAAYFSDTTPVYIVAVGIMSVSYGHITSAGVVKDGAHAITAAILLTIGLIPAIATFPFGSFDAKVSWYQYFGGGAAVVLNFVGCILFSVGEGPRLSALPELELVAHSALAALFFFGALLFLRRDFMASTFALGQLMTYAFDGIDSGSLRAAGSILMWVTAIVMIVLLCWKLKTSESALIPNLERVAGDHQNKPLLVNDTTPGNIVDDDQLHAHYGAPPDEPLPEPPTPSEGHLVDI